MDFQSCSSCTPAPAVADLLLLAKLCDQCGRIVSYHLTSTYVPQDCISVLKHATKHDLALACLASLFVCKLICKQLGINTDRTWFADVN